MPFRRIILASLLAAFAATGSAADKRFTLEGGVQVDEEQKAIEGVNARGFYFKAHDLRPKTKAQIKTAGGHYTDTYTGALSINSKAYLFEVVWNKGGEAAANSALAALKTVRVQ